MSKYIYGMHDPCPSHVLGGQGWVVVTEELGHDPLDASGGMYLGIPETVIARLNHGYHPNGTVPGPEHLDNFVRRVQRFVTHTTGECRRWVIGNEPNHSSERPNGREIAPDYYGDVYRRCRDAIKEVRPNDEVLFAAMATWNMESGDWLWYMRTALAEAGDVDAIALHCYTHGTDPELVISNEVQHGWRWQFRVYQDAIDAIPEYLLGVPLYITETNPGANPDPWPDGNGWVQEAYAEIDRWNKSGGWPIHCLCLYRWGNYDLWGIDGKDGVVEDLHEAMAHGYTRNGENGNGGEEAMRNAGFELPYTQYGSRTFVARGWLPFWGIGNPPHEHSQGPCIQPEYKPLPKSLDPVRVVEGDTAQCWFVVNAVMDAGVYQTVDVEQGKQYKFDLSAQAWCSNGEDPHVSDGEMYLALGVDPLGRTDAFEVGVLWTPWRPVDAVHRRHESVEVRAQGSKVTLFVRAWNKWKLNHNDVYVDDAHLVLVEEGQPPVPPPTPGECNALTEMQVEVIAERVAWEVIEKVAARLLGP